MPDREGVSQREAPHNILEEVRHMKRVGMSVCLMAMLLFVVWPAVAAAPDIVVQSPKPGEIVKGGLVVVKYDVKDFKIVDFTKDPSVMETQGHVHIQLDDNPVNTIHTTANVWVFAGVKPGKHHLTMYLVHSNHTPLKNKVEKEVDFTVEEK